MNIVALAQGYVLKTKLMYKKNDDYVETCCEVVS